MYFCAEEWEYDYGGFCSYASSGSKDEVNFVKFGVKLMMKQQWRIKQLELQCSEYFVEGSATNLLVQGFVGFIFAIVLFA